MTNGDKMFAMSNPTFAHWYFKEFLLKTPYCNKPVCSEDMSCERCLLEWLMQESEQSGSEHSDGGKNNERTLR